MNIAIYCGSSFGNNEVYKKEAGLCLDFLASKESSIVYGGSKSGLMGIISNTALKNNMNITGVITEELASKEIINNKVKNIIKVDSIKSRKAKMEELSDAFLVLPGGFGTFDEIFEVLTLIQVGEENKPCAFYNINGYYNKLKDFLINCTNEGFIQKRFVDMILFTQDLEKIYTHFSNYKKIKSKWE